MRNLGLWMMGALCATCYGEILPKMTLQTGGSVAVTQLNVASVEKVAGDATAARLSERSARMMTTYTVGQEGDALQWQVQSYEATLPYGGYTRTLMTVKNIGLTESEYNTRLSALPSISVPENAVCYKGIFAHIGMESSVTDNFLNTIMK
jgi:hypothetical protein